MTSAGTHSTCSELTMVYESLPLGLKNVLFLLFKNGRHRRQGSLPLVHSASHFGDRFSLVEDALIAPQCTCTGVMRGRPQACRGRCPRVCPRSPGCPQSRAPRRGCRVTPAVVMCPHPPRRWPRSPAWRRVRPWTCPAPRLPGPRTPRADAACPLRGRDTLPRAAAAHPMSLPPSSLPVSARRVTLRTVRTASRAVPGVCAQRRGLCLHWAQKRRPDTEPRYSSLPSMGIYFPLYSYSAGISWVILFTCSGKQHV